MRTQILAFMVFALAATSALAEEEPTWMISGEFSLSLEHYSSSGETGGLTLIAVKPSLDYLLPSHVTIGGQFALEHGEASGDAGGGGTSWGFFGRVGYLATVGPRAAIWAHAGLGWEHGDTELGPVFAALVSGSSPNFVTLNLTAQLLYFPVPHLFIGAGPVFQSQLFTDADSATKLTSIGFESIIGGSF